MFSVNVLLSIRIVVEYPLFVTFQLIAFDIVESAIRMLFEHIDLLFARCNITESVVDHNLLFEVHLCFESN